MLHGPAFAAHPQAVYDHLRAQGPVGWAEIAPGVHALVVTHHRAAVDLLNDTDAYSKDPGHWRDLANRYIPPDSPVLGIMGYKPSALYSDGQVHARLRWAMDDCIDRISPHELREITRRNAQTLIARVTDKGHADLMTDFADTLPLLVFAELLGCTTALSQRMVHACQALISAGPEAARGAADFAGILHELMQLRREQPGQDLTSWMLTHPGNRTDEETLYQLYCAVGAAMIPTAAWIGWALLLLLRDDTYVGSLASGTMTVRLALEKALWEYSPMANFSAHYARQDTWLHGVHIPAGVPVLISHAAANTDPTLPDLGYGNRSHLAWSAGPHHCPAIPQATEIAQTGIETVLDQMWDMELVPDAHIVRRPGPFHQCPARIPVTFRPKPATRIAAGATTTGGTA